jgi:hypothetical protein
VGTALPGVCTLLDLAEPSVRDTLYMAVPGGVAGLGISGEWDPLGMRGTVSRTLLLKDVFVSDESEMLPQERKKFNHEPSGQKSDQDGESPDREREHKRRKLPTPRRWPRRTSPD